MNQEEFNSHNKNELYRIYVDLFKKVEEKDSIIKEFVISASQFLLKKSSQMTIQRNQVKSRTNITPLIIQEVRVRRFEPKEVPTKTQNLVIGSSLVKNLVGDSTIPEDICVHDYRGSTTCEKNEVVKQLPKTVIKTVLIQDGMDSILKEKQKNIDELFEKYTDLVDITRNTLSPENIVLMQVPPIRNLPKNELINERIKLFNDKLNALAGDKNYKVANVYDLVKAMPSYDSLYYDDLHFHYKQGVPF